MPANLLQKTLLITLCLFYHSTLYADNYLTGLQAYHDKNYERAAQFFIKAASNNDHDAQYYLGLLYASGRGVEKDPAAALKLWKKATLKNQPQAYAALASYYIDQHTADKPTVTHAMQLFEKAAQYGDNNSKNLLDFLKIFMGASSPSLHHNKELLVLNRHNTPKYVDGNRVITEQDLEHGEYVYNKICGACHAHGIAGAPRVGNREEWLPRLKKGKKALYNSVFNGKGIMPPRGGGNLSDDDIIDAVNYMVK